MTLSVSKDLISPTNSSLQIAGLLAPLLLVTQGGSFDHHHQEKVAPLVIMDKSRSIQQTPFAFSDSSSAQSTSQPHPFHTKSRFLDDRTPKTEPSIDHRLSRTNTYTHTSSHKQAQYAVESCSRVAGTGAGRCVVATGRRSHHPPDRPPRHACHPEKIPREGPRPYVACPLFPGPVIMLTSVATDYSRPRNVGTLDKSDSSVGEGLVGAPAVCPS